MKKKLLILAMCLFGTLSANAASWVAIESGNPNVQVFIDTDSIKYITVDTCTYALLYKKGDEPVKIIYAKSDYTTDRAGIIRTEDFDIDKYKPGYYSRHAKAYMKDANGSSVLNSAHNYALSLYNEKGAPYYNTELSITNLKDVSYYLPDNDKVGMNDEEYNTYVANLKSTILTNWTPSMNTANSDVNLIITINSDGSYAGYRILDSNADERAKRAALAAINLSAPFATFSDGASNKRTINIPVVFEQKLFRKYIK